MNIPETVWTTETGEKIKFKDMPYPQMEGVLNELKENLTHGFEFEGLTYYVTLNTFISALEEYFEKRYEPQTILTLSYVDLQYWFGLDVDVSPSDIERIVKRLLGDDKLVEVFTDLIWKAYKHEQ